MANFTVSPGVSLNEIDNTFLTAQPTQAGAAIMGPTAKGPVNVPVKVTSYSEYTTWFGDVVTSESLNYSYFTSIAAYNYFNYGGLSLIVTRVASGSFTSATSSYVTNDELYVVDGYVQSGYTGFNIFDLETIGEGTVMNTGVTGSNGSLTLGTKDNIRWEITGPNTGSGTFNLLIRRGDDLNNKKTILESWNGVSLDPNSPKYISKVIGDQKQVYDPNTNQIIVTGNYPNRSLYVRVTAVNNPTPNYLDPNGVPKPQYVNLIPVAQNGLFNGAVGSQPTNINFYDTITSGNSQGLVGTDYDIAIDILSNSEAYQYNVLFTPGLTNDLHSSQITSIITNTQNRGDSLFVMDLTSYDGLMIDAETQAQTRDTSYAATYWPWVRIVDPATGKHIWAPASTVIPGVYAFNDKVSAPWFAPAGINRGGLSTVLRAQYRLSQSQKDTLYENNVNPLATLPKQGVVVFGQKTLQKAASALDRVNVRRLLIELKNYIRQIADTVVFEQNTISTRNSFLVRVNPYLETIQQKQGLYAFKVIMDDSNNGPDVIDRNQLVGQIYIQPTRTAEFISLDFILLPTGAEFPG
jgi:uncharacterized protein